MFYSQTYLARKGPLGTVWCAAHLQHRLKKSHYASTHIPQTVDTIMTPEVPIALRMYGHLLLGVVRIYSKKVDYFYHDCNLLWLSVRNAFRPHHANVNLPENATQATFNSVTLPATFALEDLDIDDLDVLEGSPDNHLRSQDEITLKDQYHANDELYVRITFDDDMILDPSTSTPEDLLHPDTETVPRNFRVPDPNQAEAREVIRGPDNNELFLPSPVLRPHVKSTISESNMPPTERDIDTPQSLHTSTPQMQPTTSPHGSGPSSPRLNEAHLEHGSFEAHVTSELELRPSPSPSPQRPQPRQRRRKRAFDETLVLNNKFYKDALKDTSDLVKKRKKLPSSSLEIWRFINKKKEHIFHDPLISGMCRSLQHISSKDLGALNANLLVSETAQLEPRAAESKRGPNFNEEAEHLRNPDHDPGHLFPSPHRSIGDAATPTSPRIPSVVTELQITSTVGTQTDTSIFTHNTDMNFGGTNDNLTTGFSDIPEWGNSMEPDDLLFLEQDNNAPDSQSGSGRDSMSVRTRAVVQYLKNHSPLSKQAYGSPDDLSLNAILEGRSRKLSARMFYETLVLKDCGLIDVKQDEPYADITLKLSPGISMAKL